MLKKEILLGMKEELNEIKNVTPYDLLVFSNKEDEMDYINEKTKSFDLFDILMSESEGDGIIIISEDKTYAINPIFIHSDAFRKFFMFIDNNNNLPLVLTKSDITNYFNKKGYILFRVVKHDDVIGCDPYIPEKINDYQIRALENINRTLNRVHHEIEDIDTMNDNNIKYAMKIIRNSVRENESKLIK